MPYYIMSIGLDMQNNFDQVYVSIHNTPLGEVFKTVDNQKCELFYSHYLHDFEQIIGSGKPQVYRPCTTIKSHW